MATRKIGKNALTKNQIQRRQDCERKSVHECDVNIGLLKLASRGFEFRVLSKTCLFPVEGDDLSEKRASATRALERQLFDKGSPVLCCVCFLLARSVDVCQS